jgi:GNAT superfamily N-acetyltransferase
VKLSLTIALPEDAARIAEILNASADDLTTRYGKGHWSYQTSERGVLGAINSKSKILIAKRGKTIVGTLCLQTKKPWAIDVTYFTAVPQPLYLVGMAVHPDVQRKGVGAYMLQKVPSFVKDWPAQAVRLDAYDSNAGAGDFYRKCGYTERGRVVYKGNPLIYFEWLA